MDQKNCSGPSEPPRGTIKAENGTDEPSDEPTLTIEKHERDYAHQRRKHDRQRYQCTEYSSARERECLEEKSYRDADGTSEDHTGKRDPYAPPQCRPLERVAHESPEIFERPLARTADALEQHQQDRVGYQPHEQEGEGKAQRLAPHLPLLGNALALRAESHTVSPTLAACISASNSTFPSCVSTSKKARAPV